MATLVLSSTYATYHFSEEFLRRKNICARWLAACARQTKAHTFLLNAIVLLHTVVLLPGTAQSSSDDLTFAGTTI